MLAEDAVALHYERLGAQLLARRFRTPAGEVDLIFRMDHELVFVEVKAAATHAQAAARLGIAQTRRICQAALGFCSVNTPLRPVFMRFDLACVDRTGRIEVIRGAFGGW